MAIENININGAEVTAELHGYMYQGLWKRSGVFNYGNKLGHTIVSNNEISIKDGMLSNQGRFMRIRGTESVTIENGVSGVTRIDLIVAHFETDGVNEQHDIRVIKGADDGVVPTHSTSDIYNGGTVNELVLKKVTLDGISISSVEDMFDIISSSDLNEAINALSVGTAKPTDDDYFISQKAGGGETEKTYHRRKLSSLALYIQEKFYTLFANVNHQHESVVDSGNKEESITFGYFKEEPEVIDYVPVWSNQELRTMSNTNFIDRMGLSRTSHTHDLSTMINNLEVGTSAPADDDYYVCQYAGGGTENTTYYRRPMSALITYIKSKLNLGTQVTYTLSGTTLTITEK